MSLCREEDVAADQLALISPRSSAGTECAPDDEETNSIEKFCSNCGKSGVANKDLKLCNSCKCVWYCGPACQRARRKEHKLECEQIRQISVILDGQASGIYPKMEERFCYEENDDDSITLEELPPREDCPICMLLSPQLSAYMACCGKRVCGGCIHANEFRAVEANTKETCPFCRANPPVTPEEKIDLVAKRATKNDPHALYNLAIEYLRGEAVPRDKAKMLELIHKAADLGSAKACVWIGIRYFRGNNGFEKNWERAETFWKRAAKGGSVVALHCLGDMEKEKGRLRRAVRYWRVASSAGYKACGIDLILAFRRGILSHGDLATTLQTRDKACAEMRSVQRDQYYAQRKTKGLSDFYEFT